MNKAVFGADGLIVKEGDVTLYRYNEITMEYHGSDTEFRRARIGIPAHSCVEEPLSSKAGFAVCRKKDLTGREYVVDFRGKTAYDTQSGQPCEINKPGELPVTLTFLKPETAFDQWNGEEWVTDRAALKASQTEEAKWKRMGLLYAASQTVSVLKDAAELDMDTSAEKASLPAWKEYRLKLYRTDTSKAPDIEWPVPPEQYSQ